MKIIYYGQCFLCERDVTMEKGFDSQGGSVYYCPKCSGMNSVERVENRRDIRGSVWPEYGPREEPTP